MLHVIISLSATISLIVCFEIRTLESILIVKGLVFLHVLFVYWSWASYIHLCASVIKQYNLVLAKQRSHSVAGKVTIGLALH